MSTRRSSTIRDTRWTAGVQPLKRPAKTKDQSEVAVAAQQPEVAAAAAGGGVWNFEEMMKRAEEGDMVQLDGDEESTVLCSSCNTRVAAAERSQLQEHYASDWHRANVRRTLRGKSPIGEEDWESRVEGSDGEGGERGDVSDSSSSSETECTDERTATLLGLGAARAYFVQQATVFSVYSALLRDGESSVASTPNFFARPFNCAVILLAGGHFAAGVFENNRLVVHRAIHRYVVRAKQGGAQSANDKSKGNAKSAGANLRRYNERVLREEIRGVLGKEWLVQMAAAPLVFLRCASYQRGIFISDDDEDAPLRKGDARLRTIPFETKRPLVDEVKRTWERLEEVHDHGAIEEFEKEMEERRERMRKRATALQRKGRRNEEAPSTFDDERDLDEEDERRNGIVRERREKKDLSKQEEAEKKAAEDPFPEIEQELRNSIYAAVRENVKGGAELDRVLQGVSVRRESVVRYMREARFPPINSGLLHIAAAKGAEQSVKYLLDLGCNPAVRNAEGKVPYNCSEGKIVKNVFTAWRVEIEGADEEDEGKSKRKPAIDWNKAQIPLPVEKSAEQLEKEAEKKKAKRDRQKVKTKEKKEEEMREKEEQAKKAAYMALSDREKRALAIEARLAKMDSCVVRCFTCATSITGMPFEYGANRFCSTACVANHRAKTGA
ncbi:hypothetical protein PFISCL1PPCAC_9587 [Pristionchus fissidentatus]|uniref:VLRF1 domain-containing protein n=1 Tax=Pristionchus fissidentatus TaxID=1538716 RepID=A0AAV5VF36_9BILA|nr:hypothetical protein PFISCL1PPCAC_9587 [Pristionchus fissidentatus]